VHSLIASLVLAVEETSDKKDLYPKLSELIIGLIAFSILFAFMWKWAIPRINQILEARRDKIQGDLEKAEKSRKEADQMLSDYREQLAGARDEANRIIEEARRTAESLRRDMTARAEQEYQAIVARAQEDIRTERDRVFESIKAQVGELSVALAGRVVGESLDRERHLRLVDSYIRELGGLAPSGNGHGAPGSAETEG
jgi:F-type H+-transporting ATPase subunit b